MQVHGVSWRAGAAELLTSAMGSEAACAAQETQMSWWGTGQAQVAYLKAAAVRSVAATSAARAEKGDYPIGPTTSEFGETLALSTTGRVHLKSWYGETIIVQRRPRDEESRLTQEGTWRP